MGQPRPLFVYFHSFQTQILQKKTVDVIGIRTRIDSKKALDHHRGPIMSSSILFEQYKNTCYGLKKWEQWKSLIKSQKWELLFLPGIEHVSDNFAKINPCN